MRIVYLHQYFNTPSMPGGTRSYEMARRLVQAGHEVHMVTSDRSGNSAARTSGWIRTDEAGIHAHWLPVPYGNQMSYAERIRAFLRFARHAGSKAVRLRPELVFATSTPLTIALPAVYAARRCHVPMVFEVRDLWPELPIAVGALKNPVAIGGAKRLERFAYRHSARVVALSPGMKDGILATGYPEERVEVIPNSCDLELFDVGGDPGRAMRARYSWLAERPLVVYTGTLGRINGVEYLARLAAATLTRDPEVRFLVVGSGIDEARVRQTAASLGVLNRTFFMMPDVPKAEIPAILSAATVATSLFVDLRAMWANSANKFFDALAAGKPVVINYGGWHAELLAGGAGLVLDPRDVEASAERLVAALRDAEWLAGAAAAAQQLRERYCRDRLADQLECVLRAAVDHG